MKRDLIDEKIYSQFPLLRFIIENNNFSGVESSKD